MKFIFSLLVIVLATEGKTDPLFYDPALNCQTPLSVDDNLIGRCDGRMFYIEWQESVAPEWFETDFANLMNMFQSSEGGLLSSLVDGVELARPVPWGRSNNFLLGENMVGFCHLGILSPRRADPLTPFYDAEWAATAFNFKEGDFWGGGVFGLEMESYNFFDNVGFRCFLEDVRNNVLVTMDFYPYRWTDSAETLREWIKLIMPPPVARSEGMQ